MWTKMVSTMFSRQLRMLDTLWYRTVEAFSSRKYTSAELGIRGVFSCPCMIQILRQMCRALLLDDMAEREPGALSSCTPRPGLTWHQVDEIGIADDIKEY